MPPQIEMYLRKLKEGELFDKPVKVKKIEEEDVFVRPSASRNLQMIN